MMTLPDFLLPTVVVALNARLDAELSWDGKDGRHLQAKAEAAHGSDHVGMVMRPLKHGAVIELRVIGQPKLSPMRDQALPHEHSPHRRRGPGGAPSAVQGDRVQDMGDRPSLNGEVFDLLRRLIGLAKRRTGAVLPIHMIQRLALPCERSVQNCTVARRTPNWRATPCRDWPARTAATISQRRLVDLLFTHLLAPSPRVYLVRRLDQDQMMHVSYLSI